MSRRSVASVLAFAVVAVLTIAVARTPLPYVTMQPGPTVDILSSDNGKPVVEVQGHRTYKTDGDLRLVTVSESTPDHKVRLLEALAVWFTPADGLLPRAAVYPEDTSTESERAESAAQMVTSQDTAIAAALRELDYKLDTFPEVVGVTPGGPSVGKLKVRDELVSIGGRRTPDLDSVFASLKGVKPGATLSVVLRREKKGEQHKLTVQIKTVEDSVDPKRALIGVYPNVGYHFPFDVKVTLADRIGGPSAGLMFSLAILDTLTPGPMTGGQSVAGTGTITAEGEVGAIGGIQHKIVGAQRDGATLFLVPPDNCAAALGAPYDPDKIGLVRADSMHTARMAVETYAAQADSPDPYAGLPRCTRD